MASLSKILKAIRAYHGSPHDLDTSIPGADAAASARLREAGIPGLRYLDGMSRSAGDGTHNYVTFDDSLVDIKRKYEQGGEVEMAGGGIVKQGKKAIGALARATGKGADAADELERAIPDLQIPFLQSNGQFSRFAENYPASGPPTLASKFDAKGKKLTKVVPHPMDADLTWDPLAKDGGLGDLKAEAYWAKKLTPEAQELAEARVEASRAMERSGYRPYFDPKNRFDATGYDRGADTSLLIPKQAATLEKYRALAENPEGLARLTEAFDRGMLQVEGAGDWYKMGQLQDAYIQVLGREAGTAAFKRDFAEAMAATTGGADPDANLMMAHYGNFLRNRGGGGAPSIPPTHQFPYPIGGRYAGGNMEQYRKTAERGGGFDIAKNPKRANFAANFLGDANRATIDEQMSQLFDPKMVQPEERAYGLFEGALSRLAKERNVDPRFFQEVAWAGAKDARDMAKYGGYKARPMIDIVNDAIERTHRLTGMSRDEIVARGLVRGEIPLYAEGGMVQPQAPQGPLARMARAT